MKREIKFRAWDNDTMEYSKLMPDFGFWKWVAYSSTTKIMQFTGLSDKNGKEIYEGDILYGNVDENDTVVYEENKFILQPLGDDSIFWEKSEVIGNIYENKELLND